MFFWLSDNQSKKPALKIDSHTEGTVPLQFYWLVVSIGKWSAASEVYVTGFTSNLFTVKFQELLQIF